MAATITPPPNNVLSTRFLTENRAAAISGYRSYVDYLALNKISFYSGETIVRSTLENSSRMLSNSEDIGRLVDYVRERAKRLFLLLVYIEKLKWIGAFLNSGLTDDNLPLFVVADSKSVTMRDSQNRHWRCFDEWSDFAQKSFVDYQWFFLAMPFSTVNFENRFYLEQPLEIRALSGVSGRGGFGSVRRVEIPFGQSVSKFTLTNTISLYKIEYLEVAVKYLVNPFDEKDPLKFFEKEKHTLRVMRRLEHPHLIQATGSFERGNDGGFIFPWAEGGSLQDLWFRTDTSLNNSGLLSWALSQIEGLIDGIARLNATNTHHGDLKPANILCFSTAKENLGTLVVADVGLAKMYRYYTDQRRDPTTAKYASKKYMPPEAALFKPVLSRRCDMWSLGCVLLEFLIWLTLGRAELRKFFNAAQVNKRVKKGKVYQEHKLEVPFWEGNPIRVSRFVVQWGAKVASALKNAPIKARVLEGVLELIQNRLLIIPVEYRANSQEALQHIQDVRKGGKENPPFCSDPSVQAPFESETSDTDDDMDLAISKSDTVTSKLQDVWELVTDNVLAHTLLSRAKLATPSSEPGAVLSTTCQACGKIDFGLPVINLGRALDDIRATSRECALCNLLGACLSKRTISPGQPIQLYQQQFSLSLSRSGPSLFSIYSETGLPCLPKVASPEQFGLLREWIDLCDHKHQCLDVHVCSSTSTMPTRVIDVGSPDTQSLCLVESSRAFSDRYITLSHCWGNIPPELGLRTERGNVMKLMNGIDFKCLPRTFQDAIIVTRALGLRFLWIDSLCIIQDDHADWEFESARMGDYYSSAYLTIAATSAHASTEGFLIERPDRPYATIPFGDSCFYIAEAIDNFEADVERGKLNTRAWVLQERALSRRIIHFSSTQVYWECGIGVHCETLAQLRNPQSQFLGDHNFPSLGLSYYKDERIRLIQHLHTVYTSMQLSFGTDRPTAIAGLHDRMAHTFQSKMDYGIFWRSFERSILWQANEAETLTRIIYSSGHSVPSWSWMAYQGKIGHHEVPFGKVDWTDDLKNPMIHEPQSGVLVHGLSAEARKVTTTGRDLLSSITLDMPIAADFDERLWRCIAVGNYRKKDKPGQVLCCVILIRPVFDDNDSHDVYERAGVGTLFAASLSSTTERITLR
ncbi:hypothetical protein BJ166DRAFT_473272 [Pestalotiopsis sp. NC0098]|nr:hypothetical protein BJ166DRAFT_473272 [Pestalotiopsis sp. NC0098]